MADVACFWIEPVDDAEASLRRFTFGGPADNPNPKDFRYPIRRCPAQPVVGRYQWGHDASVVLGLVPYSGEPDLLGACRSDWPRDDPRWPVCCARCAYAFQPDDLWQYNTNRRFLRPDTGARSTLADALAGALWHAAWLRSSRPTPDGLSLNCKLPDGTDWWIDGDANNGTPANPGWTRTGKVPTITVRPSILTPGYHGFLADGVLRSV